MKTRFRRRLLLVNYLAIMFFGACWLYTSLVVDLAVRMRAVELDRAHVFVREKLREFDPELEPRMNLGRWIGRPALASAIRFAQCGIGVALVNVILLHLAKPTPLTGPADEQPAEPIDTVRTLAQNAKDVKTGAGTK